MGIKEIFKQGGLELKRRSELSKVKRNQKDKTKLYEDELIVLGKKAWDSQVNIAGFEETEKAITDTQQHLSELNTLHNNLETQKKETEEFKTKENERFEGQRKTIEGKKKEVDTRLDTEKKTLKEAQKTSENATNRLTQILKEEETLNKKLVDVQTPETEKTGLREKLAAFPAERETLEQKKKETWETIATLNQAIAPIEEEAAKLQKEIDQVRAEQKAALSELDKTINDLKTKLNDVNKKINDANNEQANHFKELGGQLTARGTDNGAVATEMTAVQTTAKEIATLNTEIERLEALGTEQSRGALWKMIGLIAAAVAVVIGLIILISWLLKPKDTLSSPFNSLGTSSSTDKTEWTVNPQNLGEAMKQLANSTNDLKTASEKIQGGKIIVADKTVLTSVLPAPGGWQRAEPTFSRSQFGQLDSSQLTVEYKNGNAQAVRVSLTDAGNSSALLSATKMLFAMNIATEDENSYEKVSTTNNIPVIEKYEKQAKRGHLTFVIKERYIIALETTGENSITVLKQFVPGFNFSRLQ